MMKLKLESGESEREVRDLRFFGVGVFLVLGGSSEKFSGSIFNPLNYLIQLNTWHSVCSSSSGWHAECHQ